MGDNSKNIEFGYNAGTMSQISRRDFLKLGAAALGGLAFSPFSSQVDEFQDDWLVRVGTTSVSVYSRPDDASRIVGQWFQDDLVHVYERVEAKTPEYNPIWYRVWGGYMHRARLQQVKVLFNQPATSIRPEGQLAEVTVPYTQSMRLINNVWTKVYRLYYETVHWAVGVDEGPDGQPWYRLHDELHEIQYHVPAVHMRLIPDAELAPISPDVPWQNKRVEVDLSTQTLTAYEFDKVVLKTTISSGIPNSRPGDNGIATITPYGEFTIDSKLPSKHLGDGSLFADVGDYELPGVPWTCFFTHQGHAFHGTYWHDNFGVTMSHGCINMRNEEAKWLFLWTLPAVQVEKLSVPSNVEKIGYGTQVKIFYS